MKIMISQPMNGKPKQIIEAERENAVKLLEAEGHEVVDTIFADEPPKGGEALFYLSKSIDAMSKIDGVVFIGDWATARGCSIEYEIALAYGKFVRVLQ